MIISVMSSCKERPPTFSLSQDRSKGKNKPDTNKPPSKPVKRPKLNANQSMLEDAKVVVGIDFGTTFSGFAFASKADPDKVFAFYDWPCQAAAGAKPYCKTQSSLWYLAGKSMDALDLKDWGWPAQVNHSRAFQVNNAHANGTPNLSSLFARQPIELSSSGHFLTKFKLHLAASNSGSLSMGERLPEGLSAEQIISDYLKQLSNFIMSKLNENGSIVLKKDVQWCLTVPTIWTDAAKQTMIDCSQMAGLITGPRCRDKDASLHPIVIVLEPEAASVYCQKKLKDIHFRKGSKFLVVDAGGGTVDLVMHEKVDAFGLRVKEVTCSTGDLCGGSFVDKAFMDYLARRIDCFEKFSAKYPTTVFKIKRDWEDFKCCFDGKGDPYDLDLPAKLADAWEIHERIYGSWSADSHYDELVITTEDMKIIFDGPVNKILKLIKEQLQQVPEVEAIMVVGGFSNSPYLMKRIRGRFSSSVKHIVSPPDPGSAICQGAVTFGALGADIMMSRKSRKTYGVCMYRKFQKGDPPGSYMLGDDGEALCKDSFCVFTRIGDEVPVEHSVTHDFVPLNKDEPDIEFTMYSTSASEPEYVTDRGVVKVGSWSYRFPAVARKMKAKPQLDVTMYFGRTRIEVSIEPKNFKGGKTSVFNVSFERDLF